MDAGWLVKNLSKEEQNRYYPTRPQAVAAAQASPAGLYRIYAPECWFVVQSHLYYTGQTVEADAMGEGHLVIRVR